MSREQVLQDASWEISSWDGKPCMLLNYRTKDSLSYEIFDVDEWPSDTELGQAICRRLAAAMNYCREKTVEELEAASFANMAAPELLEALKYAKRMLNPIEHDVNYINEVIAKAEGKS